MYDPIRLTNPIPSVRVFLSRSPLRRGFLIPLVLAAFALSPTGRAVSPPPDGGYPNENTAEGEDALFNLTTGVDNTALGYHALYLNTTGSENTATGPFALEGNRTGGGNTAIGFEALRYSGSGVDNTAIGLFALLFDSIGQGNTATGAAALASNIFGNNNTATGNDALVSNQSGDNNTAIGALAMAGDDQELAGNSDNTAVGFATLYLNNSGNNNIAIGVNAMYNNISGSNNTVSGFQALNSNTTGSNNTADGNNALLHNTTGSFNIAVGNGAGGNLTTGINNIDIGNKGVAAESKTIRIGKPTKQMNTFIAGISGATVPTGVAVIVDGSGHLGTTTSSVRFKEAIEPMDKASEAILSLQPVTFRYKKYLDPEGIPQFGLVAEQVEKVNPDLVARDEQGEPYTVRYEAVNAMLLNEFLKEHRRVEGQATKSREQDATIAQLKSSIAQQNKDFKTTVAQQQKKIEALTAALKEQAAQIQKVSARLAADKPAPRVLANLN